MTREHRSAGRILLIAVCAAIASLACDDADDGGPCEPGSIVRCPIEQNGPREHRYCRADGTFSDCTPESLCDALAQTGCSAGLVCYVASLATTVCAPAETLPCGPREAWGRGNEGAGCQPLCVSEPGTLNEDPEHCAVGEVCLRADESFDVGVCYTPTDDLGE